MQISSFHFRMPVKQSGGVTLTVCPLHRVQQGCLARSPFSGEGAGREVWTTACLAVSLTLVINGQAKLLALWAALEFGTVSNWGQHSSYKVQMQSRAASTTHSLALPFFLHLGEQLRHCAEMCLQCTWRHSHSLVWLSILLKTHTFTKSLFFPSTVFKLNIHLP